MSKILDQNQVSCLCWWGLWIPQGTALAFTSARSCCSRVRAWSAQQVGGVKIRLLLCYCAVFSLSYLVEGSLILVTCHSVLMLVGNIPAFAGSRAPPTACRVLVTLLLTFGEDHVRIRL